MEDDLDDFFDEIDEAVAEVTEQGAAAAASENETADASIVQPSGEAPTATKDEAGGPTEPATMGGATKTEARPSKRARIAVASAPARPRGAVVAASAASSTKKPQGPSTSDRPPPPPPPPPEINNNNYFGPGRGSGPNGNPPLPPGPVPPLPPGPPPPQGSNNHHQTNGNQTAPTPSKPVVRMAAGKSWVDSTLSEWPENDFRIFVGNLGAEVDDTMLHDHFKSRYPSVAMSKIVREPKDQHKSKGYGFVSFLQPLDSAKAIREQDQAWLGSRPIRVKRSDWQERNKSTVKKRNRKERKQQKRRGGGRY